MMSFVQQIVFALAGFYCSLLINGNLEAQANFNTEDIIPIVDSIMDEKKGMSGPGASVTVIQNGQILLSKYYGAANLSYSIPFSEETIFPLNGFTEQLVVFAIFQMKDKMMVHLEDPINKYLPELGFTDKVTLSHLLNHSSGLPMISSLRIMAGWNFDDPFTQNDFLFLTKACSGLQDPNGIFNHNHSGIKILQMVIEKISGIDFSKYAYKHIFKPLRMMNTVIELDGVVRDSNTAMGYKYHNTTYVEVKPFYTQELCATTFTTSLDFQKWMSNYQNKTFGREILETMDESLTINDELQKRSNRSYCKGQHKYSKYRGDEEFYWTETDNGFSWKWLRSQKSGLSIMVVGNLDEYIGTKVNAIADSLISYNEDLPNIVDQMKVDTFALSEIEMEVCTGFYWNEDYLYTTEISVRDGSVYHSDVDNGFHFVMEPITRTMFKTPFGGSLEFSNIGGNQKILKNILPDGRVFISKQYDEQSLQNGDEKDFVGIYKSKDLHVFYEIVWENETLILRRTRKPDLTLTPLGNHQFRASEVDFRLITFKVNKEGAIQSMCLSNVGLKNVEFQKL